MIVRAPQDRCLGTYYASIPLCIKHRVGTSAGNVNTKNLVLALKAICVKMRILFPGL